MSAAIAIRRPAVSFLTKNRAMSSLSFFYARFSFKQLDI